MLIINILVLLGTAGLLPASVEANKQVSNNISRYHTVINTLASYIQSFCNVIISSLASGGTNCPTLPSCDDPQVDTQ